MDEKREKREKLAEIEKAIEPLLKAQESWVEVYKLLKTVEEQSLYEYEYQSFTAWLSSYAKRYNITVSLLWRQKKAGKFYENYCEYYRMMSVPVQPLEKVKVVPYVLTTIEKITAGNMQEAKALIDKAERGKISRAELDTLWELEKQEREKNGLPTKRINRHDEEEFETRSYRKFDAQATTLSDMGSALCYPDWMPVKIKFRQKYRLFTEFTKTPLFWNAFIIAESYIKQENGLVPHKFNIHIVYVKLEEKDFEGEPTFPGYCEYGDFYWIAVSRDNIKRAMEYAKAHPKIGIIYYNKGNNSINIQRQAFADISYGSKRLQTIEMLANEML